MIRRMLTLHFTCYLKEKSFWILNVLDTITRPHIEHFHLHHIRLFSAWFQLPENKYVKLYIDSWNQQVISGVILLKSNEQLKI